jgi:hypothetical protein
MAVTASFSPATGVLTIFGDALDNNIIVSRNAAGNILINGGARSDILSPTLANISAPGCWRERGLSAAKHQNPTPSSICTRDRRSLT